MSKTIERIEQIESDLKQFHGSLTGYSEQAWPDIIFSEGICYLLKNTGFIDFMLKIISYGATTNVQYWEFKAETRYGKAVFRMFAADENGEEKEYFREEYQQTCFDLTYFMIERDGNTICLQSEN